MSVPPGQRDAAHLTARGLLMGVRRRFVTVAAVAAWVAAGVLAFVPAGPRVFFLVVIFAATLTVPLLTTGLVSERLPVEIVKAARGSVHAYMLALSDCRKTHPDPDGADEEEPARLRAV